MGHECMKHDLLLGMSVDDYLFTQDIVRDVLAVLDLARMLGPNQTKLSFWYRHKICRYPFVDG
jgi:hypothetical protein